MPKIKWEPMYSVNVEEIDSQHKMLLDFMNDLYAKLETTSFDANEFSTFFLDLKKHALLHFSTEEKYFEKFNYDKAQEHMEQHRAVVNRIEELNSEYDKTNSSYVIFETLQFLDDWILVHIMEHDKKYVKCFNEHGLH